VAFKHLAVNAFSSMPGHAVLSSMPDHVVFSSMPDHALLIHTVRVL